MAPARKQVSLIPAGGHAVTLGRDALPALNARLAELDDHPRAYFILGDENTLRHCLPELLRHVPRLEDADTIVIKPGEGSKRLEVCRGIWDHLAEREADRHAVLIDLGGGVVSDIGGFVAATYKRGIAFVNVPTTLMGMVDAAIGGKTGIDLGDVKNMVGVFADPLGVYVHVPFLRTLGKRELLNGLAEMIKHGLIRDAAHWNAIRTATLHDLDALTPLIVRSAAIKAAIVAEDPREGGTRRLLNFGHTIGHAVEAHSWESPQRMLLHGEAVAIGMVCEAWLSWKMKMLDREDFDAIQEQLLSLYKPYPLSAGDHHRLIALMRHDKKFRSTADGEGRFLFTLLNGLGDARVDVEVSAAQVREAVDHYRERVRADAIDHHPQA